MVTAPSTLVESKQTRTIGGHLGTVRYVDFTPDGKRMAAAGGNRFVRVWDPASGENLQDLADQRYAVSALAFAPDGKHLLAASQDLVLRYYDYYTAEIVCKFERHPAIVHTLAFTPDGRRVLTGTELHGYSNGNKVPVEPIVLWDVASGKKLRSWENRHGGVDHLAVAPNGNFAVIAYEGKIRRINLNDNVTRSK